MAELLVNAKGYRVTRTSHSAHEDWHFCPRKFQHKRIGGWSEKEQNAAMRFGDAVEVGVRGYHEGGLEKALAEFNTHWEQFKDNKELIYKDYEGSWADLSKSGQEMLKLYDIKLPSFPFDLSVRPKFQKYGEDKPYSREVFPGTKYAGIFFTAYLDAQFKGRDSRYWAGTTIPQDRWIVDIKTSGAKLPDTPGILSLDPQLRSYAWITGIQNVGFLWFQKVGRSLKRGTEVTVLRGAGPLNAGDQGVVLGVEDTLEGIVVKILTRPQNEQFEKEAEGLKGKKLDEIKDKYMGLGFTFRSGEFTKQLLSFVPVFIPKEAIEEIGNQIEHDVVSIVNAHEENYYPQTGSVRYPAKCPDCAYLGLCLNDDKIIEERLIRVDDIKWEE